MKKHRRQYSHVDPIPTGSQFYLDLNLVLDSVVSSWLVLIKLLILVVFKAYEGSLMILHLISKANALVFKSLLYILVVSHELVREIAPTRADLDVDRSVDINKMVLALNQAHTKKLKISADFTTLHVVERGTVVPMIPPEVSPLPIKVPDGLKLKPYNMLRRSSTISNPGKSLGLDFIRPGSAPGSRRSSVELRKSPRYRDTFKGLLRAKEEMECSTPEAVKETQMTDAAEKSPCLEKRSRSRRGWSFKRRSLEISPTTECVSAEGLSTAVLGHEI